MYVYTDKIMKYKNDNNHSTKSFRYILVGVGIMLAVAVITAVIFGQFIRMVNTLEKNSPNNFSEHYIFVVDENESGFWEQVYKSAYNQAKEDGIYLENIRESLTTNPSNEELLRIAINSSADGIIYAGNNSDKIERLINKAVDKGIGVVVLHNDIERSNRQCYVGVSNYELGKLDASLILKVMPEDGLADSSIAVLVNSDMSEGAANLVVLAMEEGLLEFMEEEDLPTIETIKIDAEDTFSAEESIRNLFLKDGDLYDIVVCLESSYTQCVYQAVIDYNHVGDIKIIGYFTDEDILEGIDRDIISSTISIDTQMMGKSAILAIEEYNEMGYTNSFLPVDMEVVDKSVAKRMLDKSRNEQKE